MGKALLVSLGIAFIALLLSAMPFQRRTISALGAQNKGTLRRPTLLQRLWKSHATLSMAGERARVVAKIRDGLFEYPLMLVPVAGKHEVLCVYNFDVGYRVLVFELERGRLVNADEEIAIIVTAGNVMVRHASSEELVQLRQTVQGMRPEMFKIASLPVFGCRLCERLCSSVGSGRTYQ